MTRGEPGMTRTASCPCGAVRLELGAGGKELSVVNGSQLAPRVKCP